MLTLYKNYCRFYFKLTYRFILYNIKHFLGLPVLKYIFIQLSINTILIANIATKNISIKQIAV